MKYIRSAVRSMILRTATRRMRNVWRGCQSGGRISIRSIPEVSRPKLGHLARIIARYALRKDDFLAVIDGVEMDARADIRAPSFNELDLYCDRVASAVGRLSVRIFGMDDADGVALAYHFGRALQLTNILRDIDEDAAIGRLYLPQEALRKAGITST